MPKRLMYIVLFSVLVLTVLSMCVVAAETKPAATSNSLTSTLDSLIEAYNSRDDEEVSKLLKENLSKIKERVKTNPKDDKAHFALFIYHAMNKAHAEALKEVEQAHRLNQREVMYTYYFAVQLKENWRPVEAREVLKSVSLSMGKPYNMEMDVEELDMAIQDYTNAENTLNYFLNEAGSFNPADLSMVLSDLGYVKLYQGKHSEAIALFQESVNYLSDNFIAKTRMAEAYIKSNKVQDGVKVLEGVLKDSQHCVEALYLQGVALELLGKKTESVSYFQRAYTSRLAELKEVDYFGRDHYLMGQICTKLGKKQEAQKYFTNAQKLHYTSEAPYVKTKK